MDQQEPYPQWIVHLGTILGFICIGVILGYIFSSILTGLSLGLVLPRMTIFSIPWPNALDFSISDTGFLVFLGLFPSQNVISTWLNSHLQSQLVLSSLIGGVLGGIAFSFSVITKNEKFSDHRAFNLTSILIINFLSFSTALVLLVAIIVANILFGDSFILGLAYFVFLVILWAGLIGVLIDSPLLIVRIFIKAS